MRTPEEQLSKVHLHQKQQLIVIEIRVGESNSTVKLFENESSKFEEKFWMGIEMQQIKSNGRIMIVNTYNNSNKINIISAS